MRLFLAVVPPQRIRREVALAVRDFARRGAGRFVPQENLHLSLQFLGETPPEAVPSIQEAAESSSSLRSPFELSWGGLGAFPELSRARVAFLEVHSENDQLLSLVSAVKKSLRRALPDKPELVDQRPFRAHLTLARFRQPPDLGFLEEMKREFAPLSWRSTLDALVLVQSVLTPQGAHYTVLSEHPLKD
jgi:2'-5' RNA ligase